MAPRRGQAAMRTLAGIQTAEKVMTPDPGGAAASAPLSPIGIPGRTETIDPFSLRIETGGRSRAHTAVIPLSLSAVPCPPDVPASSPLTHPRPTR